MVTSFCCRDSRSGRSVTVAAASPQLAAAKAAEEMGLTQASIEVSTSRTYDVSHVAGGVSVRRRR